MRSSGSAEIAGPLCPSDTADHGNSRRSVSNHSCSHVNTEMPVIAISLLSSCHADRGHLH
ncbi:unnamed protein product [Staurois parvus]|uniref:Uncharacterized protein n=1 Tax=Staurois parvus TaxID=386267 RepID=A0ABN9BUI0_9NEOB|nr:unnamed protein product [Staurois parvus]